MSQGAVIRDFLVSLGFTTDNEGARKMGDTLTSITNKSVVLKTALLALATGTVLAVAKTASELDKLYYSSQRIGASAQNIRAYGDAVSQMGGDAESALQSLESVAQKMRNSPGYEGMLQGLGVATRDSNGAMRDRVEVMKDLSKTFKDMPSYQANAYAGALGIDEKTMLAMRDGKFLDNMEKYQKIRTQVGLNDDLAKSGSEFMVEFRDISMTTKAITEVVVMTAGKALLPILKLINKTLQTGIEMFDSLNPNIKTFLAAGLKIATVAVVFGGLIGVLGKIAKVLPLLKGLLFLIKGLNLAFLASPIGIVLALASAIALLWDDYKTWKNGGESLIDWSKWSDGIETAIDRIGKLVEWLGNLKDKVIDITVGMWEEAKNKVFNQTTDQVIEEAREKGKEIAVAVAEQTKVVAGVTAQALKSTTTTVISGTIKAVDSANKIVRLIKTEGTKRVYEMFDGSTETRTGGTVAWRNNNPGNLKFGFKGSADKTVKTKRSKEKALRDAQKRYSGVIALDQWGNAVFETMEAGAIAKAKLLKQQHGNKTIPEMLKRYAIDDYSGKANHKAYEGIIHKVAKSKGVNLVGKKINDMSTVEFAALAEGMVEAEGVKSGKISRVLSTNDPHMLSSSRLSNMTLNANSTNATLMPNNYSANNSTRSVIVNQNYTSEMHINGAENPQLTANSIARKTEHDLLRLSHNAKGVMA
ncbi:MULTISPECIES: phage tail tape measure protein [unclassified Acinetobacter]|uniref:phage tail tape measure protein n=1 Tax=unclassified Acinetobacter TaxID=196816 RepID=UPI002934A1CA|nr:MULTISPECIES: phage tail tape measure protein [unclassified Acinetobacter]WOE32180.1 phage tail tape measure protein [Acinetobacter sp. SAAs470]WOE37650.1 phage tail tape measure protein [Acinetobacter sp. SAAs474]